MSAPMTARCTDCGRVRKDGVWTWVELVPERAFPGLCGVCLERRQKGAVLRWNRAARRKVAMPANPRAGEGETFLGFREGDR